MLWRTLERVTSPTNRHLHVRSWRIVSEESPRVENFCVVAIMLGIIVDTLNVHFDGRPLRYNGVIYLDFFRGATDPEVNTKPL
jgi:hypothetical protein